MYSMLSILGFSCYLFNFSYSFGLDNLHQTGLKKQEEFIITSIQLIMLKYYCEKFTAFSLFLMVSFENLNISFEMLGNLF